MNWHLAHRAHQPARRIADRHYNRQKPGTPQFVPPGRCLVLHQSGALWVTSWPFAEYVKHAWPGAWVNSAFRNETDQLSSVMIRQAVAATLWRYGDPPSMGMITFVDPAKVKPTRRRGKKMYGYCYLKAGFKRDGFTQGGLWAWRMCPEDMPEPVAPIGAQLQLA